MVEKSHPGSGSEIKEGRQDQTILGSENRLLCGETRSRGAVFQKKVGLLCSASE